MCEGLVENGRSLEDKEKISMVPSSVSFLVLRLIYVLVGSTRQLSKTK